jgi:arylmalonate decarboxylase
MKAIADYSPYGWRARIGLIVPSTNTINEAEFARVAPDGVSIHTARATALGPFSEQYFIQLAETSLAQAELLATAEVDVLAYGCTSGSIIYPMARLVPALHERCPVPVIATAAAVVAALGALGVKRIAVGTPYPDFINIAEQQFLESHGFTVTSLRGLQLGETQAERRLIGRVPPQQVHRLARMIDRPEAEAIFLSCTNLATFGMIERIEQDLGKPVVTSNQASFWACLRVLGLNDAIPGHGRLLSHATGRLDPRALLPSAIG